MPRYPVQSPLKYNGTNYAEGDTVEMSDREAKELIDINVLGAAARDASAKGKNDKAE